MATAPSPHASIDSAETGWGGTTWPANPESVLPEKALCYSGPVGEQVRQSMSLRVYILWEIRFLYKIRERGLSLERGNDIANQRACGGHKTTSGGVSLSC